MPALPLFSITTSRSSLGGPARPLPSPRPQLPKNLVLGGLILMLAGLGKALYSQANVEQLRWILAPIAACVSGCSGQEFVFLPDQGYYSSYYQTLIAPACSGVNFLLLCFSMLAFQGIIRLRLWRHALIWVLLALPSSYGLTLSINCLRILLSLHLYQLDIYGTLLTPERLHRLLGILLYFPVLLAAHTLANRSLRRYRQSVVHLAAPVALSPLIWYLGFTLGIPLIRQMRLDGLVSEHGLTVLVISLACSLLHRRLRRWRHHWRRQSLLPLGAPPNQSTSTPRPSPLDRKTM